MRCVGTGLIVDIMGTGDTKATNKAVKHEASAIKLIALRADLDGLPMPENNQALPYKTQTDHAHMCGHDGHMACLISAASVLAKMRNKIPKGKGVRLLLQPAEEGPGGARPMVEAGCLNGIDEVYGFHNMPNFDEGDIRVCSGGFLAASTTIKIKVKGEGGHGSVPSKLCDPISAACAIY